MDYLLYVLNKTGNFSYVDHFKLEQPTDDIREFCARAAISMDMIVERVDLVTSKITFLFLSAKNL